MSTAILIVYLIKITVETDTKFIYLMFLISFFSACIADGIYNLSMNIFDIKYFSSINSLFEVPFAIFLLFQVIAWGSIFFKEEKKFSTGINKHSYIPYGIISALLFIMFVFGIRWKISYFSLVGAYQLMDTFLEMLGFTLATICLTRSKNLTIYFLSIGYLIIISSDILIRYNVVSGTAPYLNYCEATWVLGLLLMAIGFYASRKYEMNLLPLNSLQSNIAIWVLNICLLFVALFVVATCLFSNDLGYEFNEVNINLLSILIPFSILAIVISKYLSSKISKPLEKFENMIRKFSTNEFSSHIRDESALRDPIFEFAALENFIYDAFSIQQKNRQIEMELANISAQVAHDIRSPLAALSVLTSQDLPIPEQSRILLRSVINRIRDIANDLIEKHREKKNTMEVTEDFSIQLLTASLYLIITEKRLLLRSHSQVNIEFDASVESYGLFASINPTEFKRMLSNLINNAAEAISGECKIIVKINQENENILLTVSDNGKGVPPDILKNLGTRGMSYEKKSGSGLGLYHAVTTMKKLGGNFQIKSEVNQGTQVILTFPKTETPGWFLPELVISPDTALVILDDDVSIHQLWQERFKQLGKPLTMIHFTSPEKFETWINTLEKPQPILYFFDLEYIGYSQTGFKLIENYQLQNDSILVTSHFEEKEVREYCVKLRVKMVPKDLAVFIPISLL